MGKKHDETSEEEQPKDEGARGFAPFLQQVDDGELHTELSATLQKHVSELFLYANRFQRDAKGSITLTLNFAVLGNGNVMVAGDVKTKTPKTPRAASMFFRTQGNNLTIENPRQQKLPLRDVGGTREKPKDIAAEAAPPRGL